MTKKQRITIGLIFAIVEGTLFTFALIGLNDFLAKRIGC